MKLDYLISWLVQGLAVVAVFSGLPLVFNYYPHNAFDSLQKITSVLPYGLFIRKLHYFSSEALFVLLFVHTVYELFLAKKPKEKNNFIFASLALVLVLFLLFSGYVLKADQAGNSAALVGEHMMSDSFFLKYFYAFVADNNVFYWKFFLWHVLFLPAVFIYAVFMHIKTIFCRFDFIVLALAVSILCIFFLNMPADIFPFHTESNLSGPWFFKGIENMLKFNFPVDLAMFLGFFPFFVLAFYWYFERCRQVLNIALVLWIGFYVAVSLV